MHSGIGITLLCVIRVKSIHRYRDYTIVRNQFADEFFISSNLIFFESKYSKKSGLGIFLVPLNAEQTRVDFAYVGLTGNLKCSIDAYLQELPYLLKHNSKNEYREYSKKLRKEREKELESNRGGIR